MPSQLDPNRRFQIALERSLSQWAATDPVQAAALAGCAHTAEGVHVPFFGGMHLVTHPGGQVTFESTGRPAHVSIVIVLLHYLVSADGTPPAGRWISFRELPDGLFYSQAFAQHAEGRLAEKLGLRLEEVRKAATGLGGMALDLADASYRFQALPRVPVAALLWEDDDEFPARARILFDAHAGHYLPTEDLSGVGDWLAHRLVRQAP